VFFFFSRVKEDHLTQVGAAKNVRHINFESTHERNSVKRFCYS